MVKKYRDKTPEQQDRMKEHSRNYYNNNKESAALRAKEWRLNNTEYILEKQRINKRNRKLWAIEYLGSTCTECAQLYHPSIMEFHHINPDEKDRDPSKMMSLSLDRLKTELDKCVLLCANCHRLEHHRYDY